jgi:hypothetical protein
MLVVVWRFLGRSHRVWPKSPVGRAAERSPTTFTFWRSCFEFLDCWLVV